MSNELLKDIAELRRNMPRNATAMRICDALEAKLRQSSQSVNFTAKQNEPACSNCSGRKVYMRNYMRDYRAEKANVSA